MRRVLDWAAGAPIRGITHANMSTSVTSVDTATPQIPDRPGEHDREREVRRRGDDVRDRDRPLQAARHQELREDVERLVDEQHGGENRHHDIAAVEARRRSTRWISRSGMRSSGSASISIRPVPARMPGEEKPPLPLHARRRPRARQTPGTSTTSPPCRCRRRARRASPARRRRPPATRRARCRRRSRRSRRRSSARRARGSSTS